MREFAQPLLNVTDGSPDEIDKALTTSAILWNLAVTPEQYRERALVDMLTTLDEDRRPMFLELAKRMIARHEDMFPDLHVRT